ncbi:MAG: 2-oxo acid dehydrogenase subunit E2 [Ignavibacteria bacterium]|jgi:pyruvate/2-oxoglutarate dehydrogenase complex dihydrolipoamide acyltransferase (E2) component
MSKKGYRSIRLSFNKQAVNASVSVTMKRNAIHGIAEVDITEPRRLMKSQFEKTGEKLSLTAYIVACLSRIMKEFPELNSYKKGRRLIILDDIVISVLIERKIDDEMVPEPLGIKQADKKTFRQIQDEIREAKQNEGKRYGSISGHTWIRFIPKFLIKLSMLIADKSVFVAKQFGKVGVTAIGMFTNEAFWFIPPGSTTVHTIIGSINKKVVEIDNQFVTREYLCLTVSFDHDVVDGAPATRFINQLTEIIKSGSILKSEL